MLENKTYTFSLIEELRYNTQERRLFNIGLSLFFFVLLVIGVIISLKLKAYVKVEFGAGISVLISILLIHLITNKVLFKTKIIGKLIIKEELLATGELNIDLKTIKKLHLSNYIRSGKLPLPKWKVSDRLEIELDEDKIIVLYVSAYSIQDGKISVSDVFAQLKTKNNDFYKKIQLNNKFDFNRTK
jgi:hypothetical protein